MAPTPLPPPATPQQFLPPPAPQQPLLQSEVPDMAVLGTDALDAVQLAGMVPTPAPTPAPLLPPPTPGIPPPTPGLPPATPMPLPMDVEMPQIPPDQVDMCVHCDCMTGLYGQMVHELVHLPCWYGIMLLLGSAVLTSFMTDAQCPLLFAVYLHLAILTSRKSLSATSSHPTVCLPTFSTF